jgi:hypothetical protein
MWTPPIHRAVCLFYNLLCGYVVGGAGVNVDVTAGMREYVGMKEGGEEELSKEQVLMMERKRSLASGITAFTLHTPSDTIVYSTGA